MYVMRSRLVAFIRSHEGIDAREDGENIVIRVPFFNSTTGERGFEDITCEASIEAVKNVLGY